MRLHELTVAKAAKAIRERRVSASDLPEAFLRPIDAVEADLRAWAFVDRDGARREAERCGAPRRSGAAWSGARFTGVPFAVKDIVKTARVPTEAGSRLCRGVVPAVDATCVAWLMRAGAICLASSSRPNSPTTTPPPPALPGTSRTRWVARARARARRWRPGWSRRAGVSDGGLVGDRELAERAFPA